MDAPKCKLCGERHYGICKHAKPRPSTAAVAPEKAMVEKSSPGSDNHRIKPRRAADRTDTMVVVSALRMRPKFDRTAYQRELMRKRRTADKEKK